MFAGRGPAGHSILILAATPGVEVCKQTQQLMPLSKVTRLYLHICSLPNCCYCAHIVVSCSGVSLQPAWQYPNSLVTASNLRFNAVMMKLLHALL